MYVFQVLASSHSYKVVKKSNSCLQQIVQGLAENSFISTESLLMFAYGTASESIPALQSSIRANNKPKEKLTDGKTAKLLYQFGFYFFNKTWKNL